MTLLTPDAVWPWPVDDAAVDLEPLAIVEWGRRGDSYKCLAYQKDEWNSLGRSATPLWLLKSGHGVMRGTARSVWLDARCFGTRDHARRSDEKIDVIEIGHFGCIHSRMIPHCSPTA